jgi:hypothetical protein
VKQIICLAERFKGITPQTGIIMRLSDFIFWPLN